MRCPYCLHNETRVIDKRDSGSKTRRRRECLKCLKRFNTFEDLEQLDIRVVKKDNRREEFDKEKLKKGILRALEKRPISTDKIDNMVTKIQEKIRKEGGKEISSSDIGGIVSKELKRLDKIAYIRFASVYKDFTDLEDFKKELKGFIKF